MPGTAKTMLGLLILQTLILGGSLAAPSAEIEGRIDQVRALLEQHRPDEAKELARALVAEANALHGPDSVQAAEALDVLVEALYVGGEFRQAETIALAEQAVQLRERLHGPKHSAVARSLHQQSLIVYFDVRYEEAMALAKRALAIRRETLEADDPELAASLKWVGILYDEGGQSELGLVYLRASVEIREALDPDHPDLADSLNYLANCLLRLGRYEEALAQYRRSAQIFERARGKDDPELARSIYNQALIHQMLGEYADARRLFERSIPIFEAAGGPGHPTLLIARGGLAVLLQVTGDYAAARTQYESALDGLKQTFGDDQPYYASILTNLAALHEASGNIDDALDCYERARVIHTNAEGPDHPDVASSLSSMGRLRERLGARDEAAKLFSRALEIVESAPGENDLLLATILLDMSRSPLSPGDRKMFEPRLRRSLEIFEAALGSDHPGLVDPLTEIGELQAADGRLVDARASFGRALDLLEKSFGEEYQGSVPILHADALTLIRLRRPGEAFDATLLGAGVAREHVRATAQVLPEREALAYADHMRDNLDSALTIAVADRDSSASRVEPVWDALIRARTLVLDEMAARHRTVAASADQEVRRLSDKYRSAMERVAYLLASGPGELTPERYRLILTDARSRSEKAALELADHSGEIRSRLTRARLGLDEIRRLLPAGSGLLAYVLFERREFSSRGEAQQAGWEITPSYAAFVLGPDGAEPRLIDLGPADEIDAAVRAWRSEAGGVPPLRGPAAKEALKTYRAIGGSLREKIWDPVGAQLAEAKRVFIVPDGSVNLVNLAALPVVKDRYLVETGPTLHLLSTERDLIEPERKRGRGLLVVGAPDFESTTQTVTATTAPATTRERSRGEREYCADLGSIPFTPLPAALREVHEVSKFWSKSEEDTLRLTGQRATEQEFKRLAPGRRTIHLATHGFFLDGRCAAKTTGSRGIGALVADTPVARPDSRSGNPLVLSGLVLAGANRRADLAPGAEDGILMAEEIATLDLTGTEWAVLSACNTAVGVVRPGEGVFGLRRAFRVAGAGTVVMSLWPVEDAAAREWMRGLYGARLDAGLDTAEATRRATLGALEARRKSGRSRHPFFWAGFVAAGDWR